MTKNVIAVDVGYGNTKAVWGHSIDALGKECWAEVCFRSVAPLMMVDEEKSGGTHNPDRIALQINGKKYYAGPAASWGVEARALDPHYIDTDEHEALLRASIHIAMREKRELFEEIDMLVLGLPVSGFRSRGRRLQELASLAREVPVPSILQTAGEPRTVTVRAKQVKVIPQPFGGLRYAAEYLQEDDELFSGNALSMGSAHETEKIVR